MRARTTPAETELSPSPFPSNKSRPSRDGSRRHLALLVDTEGMQPPNIIARLARRLSSMLGTMHDDTDVAWSRATADFSLDDAHALLLCVPSTLVLVAVITSFPVFVESPFYSEPRLRLVLTSNFISAVRAFLPLLFSFWYASTILRSVEQADKRGALLAANEAKVALLGVKLRPALLTLLLRDRPAASRSFHLWRRLRGSMGLFAEVEGDGCNGAPCYTRESDPSYQLILHRLPCMGSPPADTRLWYGPDRRWYVGHASLLGTAAGDMRAAEAEADGPIDAECPPHPATVGAWEYWKPAAAEPVGGRWEAAKGFDEAKLRCIRGRQVLTKWALIAGAKQWLYWTEVAHWLLVTAIIEIVIVQPNLHAEGSLGLGVVFAFTALAATLLFAAVMRNLRVALLREQMRREGDGTRYVQRDVLRPLLHVMCLQFFVGCYASILALTEPIAGYNGVGDTRHIRYESCGDVNAAYAASPACSGGALAFDIGGSVDVGGASIGGVSGFIVAPHFVDFGGAKLDCTDQTYDGFTSTLAACKVALLAYELVAKSYSALAASVSALLWLLFREYLYQIDGSISLANWAAVLTPSIAAATALAAVGTLSIPIFLAILLVPYKQNIYPLFAVLVRFVGSSWGGALLLLNYVRAFRKGDDHRRDDLTIAERGGRLVSLRRKLAGLDATTSHWGGETRFSGEVKALVTGSATDAALGVNHFMKVDPWTFAMPSLRDGIGAIAAELEAHGTDEDRECVAYVLRQRAGSS